MHLVCILFAQIDLLEKTKNYCLLSFLSCGLTISLPYQGLCILFVVVGLSLATPRLLKPIPKTLTPTVVAINASNPSSWVNDILPVAGDELLIITGDAHYHVFWSSPPPVFGDVVVGSQQPPPGPTMNVKVDAHVEISTAFNCTSLTIRGAFVSLLPRLRVVPRGDLPW